MRDDRRALTATVLGLGAVALAGGAVLGDLAPVDVGLYAAGGVAMTALAVLCLTRVISTMTAIAVGIVCGYALFFRRLVIAPAETEADLASLEFLAFRGIVLLAGASFIALGPRWGLVASGAGIATALLALTTGPLPLGTAEAGSAAFEVALYGVIAVLMFRLLAASLEAVRASEEAARVSAELAYRDDLTGLPNRRSLSVHLRASVTRAIEGGVPDALVMFDLDHFKAVNDTLGHDVGDAVLQRVAAIASAAVRDGDVLGRWGGEEFLALLGDADVEEAAEVAERCRQAIAAADGPTAVTASFGVTAVAPTDTTTDLLRRVDLALYEAKQTGRDRVVVVPPFGADL